jgi:hypothetical protein
MVGQGMSLREENFIGHARSPQGHGGAIGAHSVFKRNSKGKITKYETYQPQTNPRDPKPWESIKRYDGGYPGKFHYNKELGQKVYEPHVHDPTHPGGVRPANPGEIP